MTATTITTASLRWRLFGPFIRPYRGRVALALLASMGSVATDLLRPWPLKIIVDNVFPTTGHHPRQFIDTLAVAVAGHGRT
ncbi:MAG: hypothetical protein M3Y74_08460, partial [Chloroflexota bacterium]|nr:hypothetical protein [Chloroflexota bacterium]